MPLITITTKAPNQPQADRALDTAAQQAIGELGDALPALFLAGADQLHLDANTPLESVQVDYGLFHTRARNAPDVWITVVFSEAQLTDEQKLEAVQYMRRIVFDWWEDKTVQQPTEINVDCFWIESHGFLSMGKVVFDW